jgi:hypothetical protein
MKKVYLCFSLVVIITTSVVLGGCIIFSRISYDVTLDTPTSGITVVTADDMRTDAKSKADIEKDKKYLFQHMLKSPEFINEQKESGKYITDRKLYLENGKLNGQGSYKFNDIGAVEGIKYESGFHYLNLGIDDSVISTNGEIIRSKDYKRIVWDSTFQELKFTMFSNDFTGSKYKSLAPFYDGKKK